MKKLFLLLLILPFNGYCSNWVQTGQTNEYRDYYDVESLKKTNNVITVWSKLVFTKTQSQGTMTYDSWLTEIQMNCSTRKFITLQSIPQLNGRPSSQLNPKQEWSSVIPDTPLEQQFKILCR